MDTSPNLSLPYLYAAQAQKHVTLNEALRRLDALVQITVLDRDLATPPATPANGARYIVAASPTGAWTGQAGSIAAFQDDAWILIAPREGWLAWVADEDTLVVCDGTAWVIVSGGAAMVNPVPLVGVNATADSTNRLAVSSPNTLLNHEGAGHQVKVNKNTTADTASFLFQTAFSGRAEMGTTGDDHFHFKVSPDGAAWKEALIVDKTTGVCSFPFTTFGGGVSDGDKGDITVSGTGTVWTIDAGTITNPKQAAMAAGTVKANVSGAVAAPSDVTLAALKTALTISNADVSGLGALATAASVNLSTQATGTLQAAQEPAHTGDVTNPAGSLATTIANNAVTNAKAAPMPANTLKGNNSGATANATDLTAAQAAAMLPAFVASGASAAKGLVPAPSTTAGATNFLREDGTWMVPSGGGGISDGDKGDITVAGSGTVWTVDPQAVSYSKIQNVSATDKLLGRLTAGAGSIEEITCSAAGRALIDDADAAAQRTTLGLGTLATQSGTFAGASSGTNTGDQTITLTGDVTGTGTGSFATAIAANAVSNAKLAQVATATLKGRATAGSGNVEDLTATQATALLNEVTGDAGAGGAKGLVPAPNAGDAAGGKFLKADGTWTVPPVGGGGGSPAGTTGELQYNNAGAFAGAANAEIHGGDLIIAVNAAPTAPSAGFVKHSAKNIAGRILPAIIDPSGLNMSLQTSFARNRIGRWNPAGNATTAPPADGIASPTATGTTTTRNASSTNLANSLRRIGYVSAATAGSLAGARQGVAQFWRGNAAGLGGFFFVTRFVVSDAATVAGARMFVGLSGTPGAPTNVEPNTVNNTIGLAQISTSSNLQLVTRDAAAAQTIDLGVNFPANTLTADAYELALFCPPNGTTIGYRVERLGTANVAVGTLSTNLPVATTMMGVQMWRSNNATALAVGFDLVSLYIETDL